MKNTQDLPYAEKIMDTISSQLRSKNVTKVVVRPKALWDIQAEPEIVKALQEALCRVAYRAGFTIAMKEQYKNSDGTAQIVFFRPHDPEYLQMMEGAQCAKK